MAPYNAGERKDVRKAEKASAIVAAFAAETIRGIMSTTSGRSWMYGRLESASIFATTFDRDPYLAAFNEGQRTQGLQLLTDIMLHCPEHYVTMTQEANVRNTIGERTRSPNGNGGDQGPSAESGSGEGPSIAEWGPEAGIDHTDA